MSWVKIDDHANEHRKQVAAGPVACWLWACGLMYANRQPTRDGFIPIGVVSMLFAGASKKLAEKLVEVGLWEATDGGYRVHDYHDYQPTQEETDERRSRRVERARKGAAARWSKEPSIAQASPKHRPSMHDAHASSIATGVLADAPDPDPDPEPVPEKNKRPPLIPPVGGEAKPAKQRASRAPGSEATADEVTAWRERWKLADAEPVEFAKFLDFHRAKGSLFVDWAAAWRTWKCNAATFARRAGRTSVQPVDMDAPWMREGYGETLGKEGTG